VLEPVVEVGSADMANIEQSSDGGYIKKIVDNASS
jgi:hypothetical protein